ncbi:tRNA synthetases class II-domain-containing protein [Xylaria cf. heliscus]|nr:tRNA synthetases class II-domain-containing protein [Xylaria cf. heliscus]
MDFNFSCNFNLNLDFGPLLTPRTRGLRPHLRFLSLTPNSNSTRSLVSSIALNSSDGTKLNDTTNPVEYKFVGRHVAYMRVGQPVILNGFLGKRRDQGSNLSFVGFESHSPGSPSVQIVSSWDTKDSVEYQAYLDLKSVPAYSPVRVEGIVRERRATREANDEPTPEPTPQSTSKATSKPTPKSTPKSTLKSSQLKFDIELRSIVCLNPFPKNIIVSKDAVWPLESRHLQMRFDPHLRQRLQFRSSLQQFIRTRLLGSFGFTEVETPILFKSTPEGAREFLVPTRQRERVYALPQSPQQYKQILMAGGIRRYFQFAKCFRDEDSRADRQPEFTQLDFEVAFASGSEIMSIIEALMWSLHEYLSKYTFTTINGVRHLTPLAESAPGSRGFRLLKPTEVRKPFKVMTYDYAMRRTGTDKPDLRIREPVASMIIPIQQWLDSDVTKTITKIQDSVVEACRFRFSCSRQMAAEFIREFFDNLPNGLSSPNTPVFIIDSSKPLQGLSALGHEAAQNLLAYERNGWSRLQENDVLIVHGREREQEGSSTELGRLRKLIYDSAVEKGLLPKNNSFNFVWITKFPMFTASGDGPGQGGLGDLSATHHPFTAPHGPQDVNLLRSNPRRAYGDSYDLVLNGVEIGGGSRRIHIAAVQEYVFREVLKMTSEGVSHFSHLLNALRAGCPPHAGFAFGFDRFIAMICNTPSIRDVIAFPKNNKGQDLLVGSPSKLTAAQQKTYSLFPRLQPNPQPTTT